MTGYPTLEEYQARGNYQDGVERCGRLLARRPHDTHLLILKHQLCCAAGVSSDDVLDKLLSLPPATITQADLLAIDDAAINAQKNAAPVPDTTGPLVSKLWENAVKSCRSTHDKLDLLLSRFDHSMMNNYTADAQQVLIQLKALQPQNRTIFLAHAAVTHLLSREKGDVQSRLALMLAKKAVSEKYDGDKTLDCRVPGQIFALRRELADLRSIQGRAFAESKQVYEVCGGTFSGKGDGLQLSSPGTSAQAVGGSTWFTADVASLEEGFSNLIATSSGRDVAAAFVSRSIRVFHRALTSLPKESLRTKAHACFIAISALAWSFEEWREPHFLLEAAYLAMVILQHDAHIYEARMILVYLYVRLGLGSEAMRYYESLRIKEVQLDTVGHALFTHLASIHPHECSIGSDEMFRPIKRAGDALRAYHRFESKLAATEASVLSHGQTGMIFDLHDLRHRLRQSITRRIFAVERRRMERLVLGRHGQHSDEEESGICRLDHWMDWTDNRDFHATVDYGYEMEKALQNHGGSLPPQTHFLQSLALDVGWCLASGQELLMPDGDMDQLISVVEATVFGDRAGQNGPASNDDEAERLVEQLKNSAPVEGEGVFDHSAFERRCGELTCCALRLTVNLRRSGPGTIAAEDIDLVRRGVAKLDVASLVASPDPWAMKLRPCFMSVDVLRVVAKACESASSRVHGKAAGALTAAVQRDLNALQGFAEAQRKSVEGKGIRGVMRRSEVWDAISLFGGKEVGGFCEGVAASAEDGWIGLCQCMAGGR